LRASLQTFFVRDSEALLFVNDEQTEIGRRCPLKQAMLPMTTSTFRLQVRQEFSFVRSGAERLNISILAEARTALERFEVLECEDGGGRDRTVCHPRQL